MSEEGSIAGPKKGIRSASDARSRNSGQVFCSNTNDSKQDESSWKEYGANCYY